MSAVLAAVMSTTDALILAVSSAAVNDIYKKHIKAGCDRQRSCKISLVFTWVAGLLAFTLH